MSYLSVVPLAEMKTYLRIDSGLTDDDGDIQLMIATAGKMIENRTGHILYSRNKTYVLRDGCVRVYDTPITAVVSPADEDDYDEKVKTLYRLYQVYDADVDVIELTVGYASADDVPDELKLAIKQLVAHWYFGADRQEAVVDVPNSVLTALGMFKRFLV